MEVHKISIDAITVGKRMRSLKEDRIDALADSIKTIGLQTPISVWTDDDGTEVRLVAGAHRLAAARKLEWEDIDCVLVNMDDIECKLWEIAENLHRADLTAQERSEQVAEWVKLSEQKRERDAEVSRQVGAKPNGGRPESGTRAAARELGMKETSVRRAVKIADLPDDAKDAAREAGLDNNQSALERIARSDDKLGEVAAIQQERAEREERKARRQESEHDEEDDGDEEIEWPEEYEAAYAEWDQQPKIVREQWIADNWKLCMKVLTEQGRI